MKSILFIFLVQVLGEYQLVSKNFTQEDILTSSWNNYGQCTTNSQYYAKFDYAHSQFTILATCEKAIHLSVIFEIFLIGAATVNTTMNLKMGDLYVSTTIWSIQYNSTGISQKSNRLCTGGADSFFNSSTQFIEGIQLLHPSFQVSLILDSPTSIVQIGLKNLMVYISFCYPKCRSCYYIYKYNCLYCYYGQTTSGECQCDPQHQFAMTQIGCLQECPRDYYISDQDFICVSDRRIKSHISYFTGFTISTTNSPIYYPFIFIQDPLNINSRQLIGYDCIYGKQFVGQFFYKEGVTLQIDTIQALQFLRLRISFILFNLKQGSTISLLLNGDIKTQIRRSDTNYEIINSTTIFFKVAHNVCDQAIVRLETFVKINSSNPVLEIMGSLKDFKESWGFYNVTIDAGLCQENCQVCSDFNSCSQCISGFVLYQKGCIQSCPIHSQNCIDYSDELPYSTYVVKDFYNLNMSVYDITKYQSYQSQVIFSFFPDKLVLGGPMIWFNETLYRFVYIYQPHYAMSIRFNFTFGDEFAGIFQYNIDNIAIEAFNIPSSGGQNIVGNLNKEITVNIYKYIPHTTFVSNFTFDCQAPPSLDKRDGFCAISELFIIAHNCPPLCIQCTSATNCVTWKSGYSSSSCSTNEYLSFYESTGTYSCKSCQPLTCSQQNILEDQCVSCPNVSNLWSYFVFQSNNQYEPCNRYCENCYGDGEDECLSCVSEFHRSYKFSKCLCQPGYYDDGFNLPCLPICGDGFVVDGEDCDDVNNNPFDGCYQCQYSCSQYCNLCVLGVCIECLDGFFLFINECLPTFDIVSCPDGCKTCLINRCLECDYGFQLLDKINQCKSICGDQLMAKDEECDVGNIDLYDGCLNCKYSCHKQCTTCIKGQCYQCQGQGFQLNIETHNCETICGDQLVVGYEQCDDGNDIQEDGCQDCQYQCQQSCTDCRFGICFSCSPGWIFDFINEVCIPLCGDNIIVPFYEDCEDGNNIPYDGCYKCKFQCQDQCTDCKKGICQACDTEGWYIENNICLPFCGDRMVIVGIEQCDDANDEQYDGCYNCQYQCQKQCTSCQQGVCYECDILGWIEQNNRCTPYCGDGLVKGNEQCDDKNNDDNDGCYECKFYCDQYCTNCQDGICFECIYGRKILQSQLNRCETECGDSIYVSMTEQCDDGNDQNKDGCNSRCLVETDFACTNTEGSKSVCVYSKQPEIVLEIKSKDSSSIIIVYLTFTQQMKRSKDIKGDILNYIVANIRNMPIDQYSISVELNQLISTEEVSEVILTLTVDFFQSVQSPELIIQIKDNALISYFEQSLKDDQATIILPSTSILSDSSKSLALSTQQFNKAVIYFLSSLSFLCLLTGSSDLFWNLLDQLQYLSYIKYINIKFPTNLNLYFEVFKLITISPLLNILKFDVLFSYLDGETDYYIQTQGKFSSDNLNAYFYINFQSFLFCIISTFFYYYVNKLIIISLYRIRLFHFCRLNYKISLIFYRAKQTCKKQQYNFFYNGILRIVMSNWYDISFAAILQLAYYDSGDYILKFNYCLALCLFLSQLSLTLFILGKINSFFKQTALTKRKQYETLFDDVKNCKKIWVMQYNSILLLKKQLFILILVFMQQQGTLQAICITILQTLYLLYIISNNPLNNSFEHYKSIITELILIFNSLTFIIYAYSSEMQLTQDTILNLGWIHIFTSSMILATSCFFDFIQQFSSLIKKLQKALHKPKPSPSQQLFQTISHQPQLIFKGF